MQRNRDGSMHSELCTLAALARLSRRPGGPCSALRNARECLGRPLPSLASLFIAIAFPFLTHMSAGAAQVSQEQLLAVLTSNAPLTQKWVAAHELARVGTREAVPKLLAPLPAPSASPLAPLPHR